MGNNTLVNIAKFFTEKLPSVMSLGLRDEVTLAVEKVLNSPVSFPFTFQEAIQRDIVWDTFMKEENIEQLTRGVCMIILIQGPSSFFQELYDSLHDTENLDILKAQHGDEVVDLWIRNMQISLYVLTHYADRFLIVPPASDSNAITSELPQTVEVQIAPVKKEEKHEATSDVIGEHQKMEMNSGLGKNMDESDGKIITQIIEENIKNLFKKLTRGEIKTMIGLVFDESTSTKKFEEFLVSLNRSEKRVSTKIANLLRSLYTNKYYNKAYYLLPSNTDESVSAVSHLKHLVMSFVDYQGFLPGKSPVVPLVTVSENIETSSIVGEVTISTYPQNIESAKVVEFIQILKTAKDTKGNTGAYELFLVGLRDSILQGDVKKMLVSLKEKYNLPQIPSTVPALITRLQGGIYRAVGEVGMLPYLQLIFKSFYSELIPQKIPKAQEDLPVPVIVEEIPNAKEDVTVIIKAEPIIVKQPEEVKQTISSKKTEESWENRSKFLFDAQDPEWTRETLIPFLESLHLYFTKNNPSLLSQIRKNIEKNNIGVEKLVSSVRALVIQGGATIKGSYSAVFVGAQRILGSKDSKLVLRYAFFYPFDREVGGESVLLKTNGSSIAEKKTMDSIDREGAERILVERVKNLDLFKEGILISVDLFQQKIAEYNDFQSLLKLLSDWNESFKISGNGSQNMFPYIWMIIRKIQHINASHLLNQPQCSTLLGQLKKILGKYKEQKDFLQKIPEDLKDFLANNFKIEFNSSPRMIGSTPQRSRKGFTPKARL